MKRLLYVTGELAYFILVGIPIATLVIIAMYLGFLIYDTVNYLKKVYEKVSKKHGRDDISKRP